MVASKAVGRKYGVAKAVSSCSESFFPCLVHWHITLSLAFLPTYHSDAGPNRADYSPSQATLVSVKMFPAAGNWENAMWEILNDIKAHPGREFRSVVTTGVAIDKFMTPAEAKADKEIQELYGDHLRELSALGVPFVTATGNGDSPDHPREVDQIPSVLQGDDMPLIVVGAADYEGHKWEKSQAGDLVTLYAPGVDIDCQFKDGTEFTDSGSSLGKHPPNNRAYTRSDAQCSRPSGCRCYRNIHVVCDQTMG
jgi:hypothetical protein